MTIIHKTAGVLIAAAILAAVPAAQRDAHAESGVSVLCYHSFIQKKKMDPFCFTIDELNSHIMQLKKEGFRFVSVGDIVGGRITGTKNVLISVDDGNKSVYEAYRKVFRPNGIRPLLGIYPNIIINKKKYALTWEQLRELADAGCDIAAHGYFHLKVNRALYDTDPRSFKKEIFLSKKVLEEHLGRKVAVYVYPFGLRDDLTIRTLREAGFRYAFTIDRGRIDIPLAAGNDRRYELPRYMVTRTSWNYCFDRVMKNARPKVSYRVAAADVRETTPARPAPAVRTAHAFRHDAAADPYPDMEEGIFSVVTRDRARAIKKKIVTTPRIASDGAPADGGEPLLSPHDASMIEPGPGRERDVFDPLRTQWTGPPVASGLNGAPLILNAGVVTGTGGFDEKMRARYNDLNRGSSRAYQAFLGRVKEKMGRIRLKIRKYVVANF